MSVDPVVSRLSWRELIAPVIRHTYKAKLSFENRGFMRVYEAQQYLSVVVSPGELHKETHEEQDAVF